MDEASFKREDYLLFLMTEYSQLKLLGTTKIRKRPRNKGHEKLPRTGPYPEDKNEKSPSPNAQKNPLSAGARPYLRFFIVQRISWGGGTSIVRERSLFRRTTPSVRRAPTRHAYKISFSASANTVKWHIDKSLFLR